MCVYKIIESVLVLIFILFGGGLRLRNSSKIRNTARAGPARACSARTSEIFHKIWENIKLAFGQAQTKKKS